MATMTPAELIDAEIQQQQTLILSLQQQQMVVEAQIANQIAALQTNITRLQSQKATLPQ